MIASSFFYNSNTTKSQTYYCNSRSNLTNVSAKFAGCGGNSSSIAAKRLKIQPILKKTGIYQPKNFNSHEINKFTKHFLRGDIPIAVNFIGTQRKIQWKIDIEKIDYHRNLPLFFEGLREVKEPYNKQFLSDAGCDFLLENGGMKTLSVLPQLIGPIKNALETKDHAIMCKTLKKIQKLVISNKYIGEALVSYYKQILPILNVFKTHRLNYGIHNQSLGDLIQETLEILEKNGGKEAYANIKYMIPTYESCIS
ncbi:parkin coregulated gene protein, putative [Ichthyophthirius multifiliis]|uniref:Parkin coregulated gene protein, putative n=1 Tax=Ichthyophthirius multifiliis TaxID=5932 RepID=G0QMR9_ICHMU|nr:parkin coregulated gene protein, putative [Ichthyophthirius multifiliis]EGR33472.1 parkin coregulated gene protein, putative [Ichthyophthirius multifiliis]|eukprot:XP_004037458.1 parkin coregulated gene protein, putative [Ichthyophthirius multifiliis]